jgi:hypothetical protein
VIKRLGGPAEDHDSVEILEKPNDDTTDEKEQFCGLSKKIEKNRPVSSDSSDKCTSKVATESTNV